MYELLLATGGVKPSTPFNPPAVSDSTVFKGFIKSTALIDGDSLASKLGITTGVSQNYDAGWLKYVSTEGMVFYIARKTLRYRAQGKALKDAMNGKTLIIGGREYLVRSLTGRAVGSNTDGVGTAGGEWNQYIYPIYSGSRRSAMPSGTPQWSSYTDDDLGLAGYQAPMFNGSSTIVDDYVGIGVDSSGTRGTNGSSPPTGDVVGSYYQDGSTLQFYQGWRPILIDKATMPVYPFRGEVAQKDFITYANLATAVSMDTTTTGNGNAIAANASDPWLHFIDNGKEFYIAKKAIRSSVLWTRMNTLGIVTGTKTVVIDGKTYKVRLMTGTSTDPGTTAGGEWNTYFYPLYNQPGVVDPMFQTTRWANYTNADLGLSTSATYPGTMTLVQSRRAAGGTDYNARGWGSTTAEVMTKVHYQAGDSTNAGYGWRPVLELVP